MCHCFQVTLNGWHLPIRPGRDLACSPVTGDAPLLGCLAPESFLLYLAWNEALATQVQICYLKSHTSLSVTQAVMLNTLQLVFERIRRGVTNPCLWSHRQHINCSNPCLFHGCFTQTALLWAGGGTLTSPGLGGEKPAGVAAAIISQLPWTELHVPPQHHAAPCRDRGVLQPGPSAVPSAPSPACAMCPVACCLFGIWLFRPKRLGITEVT